MMRSNCEHCGCVTRGQLRLVLAALFTANFVFTLILASAIGPRNNVSHNSQHVTVIKRCCEEFESAETPNTSTGHPVQSGEDNLMPFDSGRGIDQTTGLSVGFIPQ